MDFNLAKSIGLCMAIFSSFVGSSAFANTATALDSASGVGYIVTYHGDTNPDARIYASTSGDAPMGFDTAGVNILKTFGAQFYCYHPEVVDSIQFFIDYSTVPAVLDDTGRLLVYGSEISDGIMTYSSKPFTIVPEEQRIYYEKTAFAMGVSYGALVLARQVEPAATASMPRQNSITESAGMTVTADRLTFSGFQAGDVTVTLGDCRGRSIATLFKGAVVGAKSVISLNDITASLAAGTYVVSIRTANSMMFSRKLVIR